MIFPTELLEASLLWEECKCRSPFSHTPLVRLAMGGSRPGTVGSQGLLCVVCPSAPPAAIVINNVIHTMPRPNELFILHLFVPQIIEDLSMGYYEIIIKRTCGGLKII